MLRVRTRNVILFSTVLPALSRKIASFLAIYRLPVHTCRIPRKGLEGRGAFPKGMERGSLTGAWAEPRKARFPALFAPEMRPKYLKNLLYRRIAG
jgi:hypothetical protein